MVTTCHYGHSQYWKLLLSIDIKSYRFQTLTCDVLSMHQVVSERTEVFKIKISPHESRLTHLKHLLCSNEAVFHHNQSVWM